MLQTSCWSLNASPFASFGSPPSHHSDAQEWTASDWTGCLPAPLHKPFLCSKTVIPVTCTLLSWPQGEIWPVCKSVMDRRSIPPTVYLHNI